MLDNNAASHLIARYGYLAVLAGTMLEGETVVLAAGYLAHQGYLSIPWIILFAIIGSGISDQGLFFLSRLKGKAVLARFPKVASRVNAVSEKLRSRQGALTAFALFFRFLYGLRNIAPLFLGMSSITTPRFILLNVAGSILWSTTFSLLGYAFARVLHTFMGTMAKVEIFGLVLLVGGSMAFFAYRRWKKLKTLPDTPVTDERAQGNDAQDGKGKADAPAEQSLPKSGN